MRSNDILFLSVTAAALRIGVSASWLNKLRINGGGPPFFKLGRRVTYGESELLDWAQQHRHIAAPKEQADPNSSL